MPSVTFLLLPSARLQESWRSLSVVCSKKLLILAIMLSQISWAFACCSEIQRDGKAIRTVGPHGHIEPQTRAIKCLSQDAVNAAFAETTLTTMDLSSKHSLAAIRIRLLSHKVRTNVETQSVTTHLTFSIPLMLCSAHIARCCAESRQPMNFIEDRKFKILMQAQAGRPSTTIPSPMTIARDLKAAFNRCRDMVAHFSG